MSEFLETARSRKAKETNDAVNAAVQTDPTIKEAAWQYKHNQLSYDDFLARVRALLPGVNAFTQGYAANRLIAYYGDHLS